MDEYTGTLPGADARVYKTAGDAALHVNLFCPPDHQPTDSRAAIIFFFGGGWRQGSVAQFHRHCLHLASRGMVAAAADYRVASRHGTTPLEAVSDAKSAVRWPRPRAPELGIDPDRIAAGGGSAGGHIAASSGTLPLFDEPGEDLSVSSVPNAMVLFNPVADTTETGWTRAAEFMGDRAHDASPAHHVGEHTPPTLILHGTADTTVPIENVRRFRDIMTGKGKRCDLVEYEGAAHAFFNREYFVDTLLAADGFLDSLGYLEGTVDKADVARFEHI